MAKRWKSDYSYVVQDAMKQAGWAMHLFRATAAGIVHPLTDDELEELDYYLEHMGTGNCWWAEYEAREPMRMAVQIERNRRYEARKERDQGQPVVFNHWATPSHI